MGTAFRIFPSHQERFSGPSLDAAFARTRNDRADDRLPMGAYKIVFALWAEYEYEYASFFSPS